MGFQKRENERTSSGKIKTQKKKKNEYEFGSYFIHLFMLLFYSIIFFIRFLIWCKRHIF
jgi:hypothetical protein